MIQMGRHRRRSTLAAPAILDAASGNSAPFDTGNQQMDFAEPGGGGDGGERRVVDRAALMFDQHQHRHGPLPAPFSLPDQFIDAADLPPAVRLGGSVTFSVSSRLAVSTP